jgi:glycosyltransferase involved in cell wall biosynthesis
VTPARRIVVNTAIYLHGTSGTATATRQLVAALGQLAEVEVLEAAPRRRGGPIAMWNAARDARWDLWGASHAFPDVDLLVSPCNIGRRGRARRHVLVVHDLMAIDRPELFDRKFSAYFRALVPRSIRSADRVLTPSEHSRESILRIVPEADVRVVPWAYAASPGDPADWPKLPTVLMVGATEPVKNQVGGVRAVHRLRERTGADVRLRVIGPEGRAEAAVRAELTECDPTAAWTSREVDVPADTLAAAYSTSWLLLQPSLDEGFGLPLVEAAARRLPVVHSGRGAMPELVPEVDVGAIDPEALAAAMEPLLDRAAWERLAARSTDVAARYSQAVLRDAVHRNVADLVDAL